MNRGHIEHSPDESIRDNGAPVQKVVHHDHGSKLLPWIMVACFFSGGSLIGMLWAISKASEAKRIAEVQTMRVEGLTRALIAHGITDTYPHLPGEDD